MEKIQTSLTGIESARLQLGFEGEQNHTRVVIYCTQLFGEYPDAVATMVIKPPVGDIYPKALVRDGMKVIWDASAADCATPGNGQYQLTFTVGDEIIKTYIGEYTVLPSLIGNGEAPTPVEEWMREASVVLEELQEFDNMTASATKLPSGSEPTARVESIEGRRNIAFGIPAGESGEMVVETVTGATPTITGVSNHRYLCGTVTTISITPPASGIVDVVFTSGATAAVLTVPNTVTFPEWFNPAELQTNKTYEINIADGMGVVAVWA